MINWIISIVVAYLVGWLDDWSTWEKLMFAAVFCVALNTVKGIIKINIIKKNKIEK